jgi:hypothetical protein
MSPVTRNVSVEALNYLPGWELEHTLTVLEFPLNQRVIDIGVNLEPLQVQLHRLQAGLPRVLASSLLRRQSLNPRNPLPHLLNFLQFFCPVGKQNPSRFLETLVGQLLEGEVGRILQRSTATTRSDGSGSLSHQPSLQPGT